MFPLLNPPVLRGKESATLAINQRALQMRREGNDITHFGFGQSPFPVPDAIQEALRRNTDKKDYLPSRGLPELCTAVAAFYRREFGYDFAAENVFIGPGSKELIFHTLYLLEGPLLIPAPNWANYALNAALRGKRIVPVKTLRNDGYRLKAADLDRACHRSGEGQKMLILSNPNNPTGGVYRREELGALAEVCRAHRVIVISDEIYAMLNYTDGPHVGMAHFYPEGTIVTGGLSKSFAAGGYRLGVMLIPRELSLMVRALLSVISETFSAVSAPIQYAALEAYENFEGVRPFIRKTGEIHRYVCEYMHRRLISMGLHCPPPEGAFFLFPDFRDQHRLLHGQNIRTGRRLCDRLLERARVVVLPGSDFYLPATELTVRIAAVDYDGDAVLTAWPGVDGMTDRLLAGLFPRLVGGCDRLEAFMGELREPGL
jgi:aspartate/methionine/tyrosine aminotransferase